MVFAYGRRVSDAKTQWYELRKRKDVEPTLFGDCIRATKGFGGYTRDPQCVRIVPFESSLVRTTLAVETLQMDFELGCFDP